MIEQPEETKLTIDYSLITKYIDKGVLEYLQNIKDTPIENLESDGFYMIKNEYIALNNIIKALNINPNITNEICFFFELLKFFEDSVHPTGSWVKEAKKALKRLEQEVSLFHELLVSSDNEVSQISIKFKDRTTSKSKVYKLEKESLSDLIKCGLQLQMPKDVFLELSNQHFKISESIPAKEYIDNNRKVAQCIFNLIKNHSSIEDFDIRRFIYTLYRHADVQGLSSYNADDYKQVDDLIKKWIIRG